MKQLGKFSIEEVLPFAGKGWPKRIYQVKDVCFKVKMNSLKFDCFKKAMYCVVCGLKGNLFILEQCRADSEVPTLNLYHIYKDGGLTLMTKDHIIPVSKGGRNHTDNLQTMCINCNSKKGNIIPDDIMLTAVPLRLLGAMFSLCANY